MDCPAQHSPCVLSPLLPPSLHDILKYPNHSIRSESASARLLKAKRSTASVSDLCENASKHDPTREGVHMIVYTTKIDLLSGVTFRATRDPGTF